ncbi:hypothetical protein AM305_02293 [Actinobacillus minor NM305]|uniref:Surface protein n=1 Tax=Actinobacillus minor NM305 TaxID=637911 RepID=C5S473_9PAST|nr:lysine exporter LysO family protein [Actinobacillus minor]EER46294.1 hypothetical protein AM305_02293 [Actinobacillus minor NM305]
MLYGLAIVLIPLFIGYLFKVTHHEILSIVNKVVSICLYLILLVIGISLGQLDDIVTKLPQIGTTALTLSLIIHSCNILALVVYDKWQPMKREVVAQDELPSRFSQLLDSLKLVGTTMAGGILGFLTKGMVEFPLHASTYVLVIMIFGVGIQLRNSGIPLREVFLNKRGIYTSIVFIISSLIGGAISAWVLALPLAKGLTFASAFGWYSLSSVLVNDAWGAIYGSIAFFNDLSREILCLFMIPFFMRLFPSTAVGLGGATSLDCTLPIIQKSGGIQVVPLAISFGFIVNLVAPLLLAIFIGLGSV